MWRRFLLYLVVAAATLWGVYCVPFMWNCYSREGWLHPLARMRCETALWGYLLENR